MEMTCPRCGSKSKFKHREHDEAKSKLRDDDLIIKTLECSKCRYVVAEERTTRRLDRTKREIRGMQRRLDQKKRNGREPASLVRALDRRKDLCGRLEAEIEAGKIHEADADPLPEAAS